MKRRSFFSSLLGIAAIAPAVKSAPAPNFAEGGFVPPGVPYIAGERSCYHHEGGFVPPGVPYIAGERSCYHHYNIYGAQNPREVIRQMMDFQKRQKALGVIQGI